MSLKTTYGPGRFALSFELFPPKTSDGETALFAHLVQLVKFAPAFITCTYGAGGSSRDKTLAVVAEVKRRFQVPVASHLTCVGSSVDHLREYLTQATHGGVDYVVALRGDPPKGETEFQPADGGLRYANELVALLRAEFPHFGVAVGGYPEKHVEAPSFEADLENLRRKVDAGADAVLTQLFYDNQDFFRFRERCQQAGIRVPIVPGILPVTNFAQVQRLSSMCHARLPRGLVESLEARQDPVSQFQVGVDYAIRQVGELIRQDVPGLHFFLLNKSQAASCVLAEVDLPPRTPPG
ncbi:MAG: methylenetetrahydrofolate reductase [NAD(P)H] [Candidatus Anammoximicrobium sp.]|nr:methylenetetrahydrofolate reductase [NAD(P)H] [Candidatus Anammoximicrobium sp.]